MGIIKVNPHSLRCGIIQSSEDRYKEFIEMLINDGKIETTEEVQSVLKEEIRRRYTNMGQKVDPHGLRIGVVKDWDSKWYLEKDDNSVFISNEMIHHSLENRKIHLVQLLGKRKYKETVNKVKTLSRW